MRCVCFQCCFQPCSVAHLASSAGELHLLQPAPAVSYIPLIFGMVLHADPSLLRLFSVGMQSLFGNCLGTKLTLGDFWDSLPFAHSLCPPPPPPPHTHTSTPSPPPSSCFFQMNLVLLEKAKLHTKKERAVCKRAVPCCVRPSQRMEVHLSVAFNPPCKSIVKCHRQAQSRCFDCFCSATFASTSRGKSAVMFGDDFSECCDNFSAGVMGKE